MCGIVGYTGFEQAAPLLLAGLTKLEYRGYDSSGVAIQTDKGIVVAKAKGRLSVLQEMLNDGQKLTGTTGIGHTRWATHGEPSDVNSHPHLSPSGKFAVVHNGIIENYLELKEKLTHKGFIFRSETDTEVIAHLLEYYDKGDILDTVIRMQNVLKGSYALGVLAQNNPDEIIAVRKDSPLIVGVCQDGSIMASDIPAILSYTRDFYQLEEKEIVIIRRDSIRFFDSNKETVIKDTFHVDWDVDAAEKGGYEHFMIKEIMEQPKALTDTISPRIKENEIYFDAFHMSEEEIRSIDKLYIVACGSAAYTGIVGKYVIQQLSRIPVEVELASEFRYSTPIISPNTLVVVISQSGETADSLAALRYAKAAGAKTLAVVNVIGSAIAKEAHTVIYTNAGPEIAVATTKAYSCQLSVLYMLAIYLGRRQGLIDDGQNEALLSALRQLPDQVADILKHKDDIQYFASRHYGAKDVFFIGRNLDYASCLEGSLKLKEISYIHSEAYAAGELKHGTIALIEQGTLVVAIAAIEPMFEKIMSNVREVKARGAFALGLTWAGNDVIQKTCDYAFYIPRTMDVFTPTLTVIPLQLFAYYTASMRGLDIDKPRNLAKSVTVE